MTTWTYEDQKDKEGLVIGQYANIDEIKAIAAKPKITLSKEELIRKRDILEAELLEKTNEINKEITQLNEIINGMR